MTETLDIKAMANAPLRPEGAPEAPKTPEPVKTVKPVKTTPAPLPTPTFAMVANPKFYEDRSDKSKSNGRIAHVLLTQGSFTFEASIYLEIKVEQRPDGRHETKGIRFSLPKGVKLLDSVTPDRADAWKDSIIDTFLKWRKDNGGAVVSARAAVAGFRTLE